MRGCGTASTCHGVNTGASARIEGPMNLMPGARGTYTLVITSTRSDFMNGGFNIAASGATLARNGTVGQLMSGELTHSAPIARSGAEVRVPFDVVAPATANLIAKFAHGIADDALGAIHLATLAPVLIAPAMNGKMWEHPATQANVETLLGRGVSFIGPEEGLLACGYEGVGRLWPIEGIEAKIEEMLAAKG